MSNDLHHGTATGALAGVALGIALVLGSPPSQAALLGRDINGNPTATNTDPAAVFVYDTDLDITWLRDWNYAQTSNFDLDGKLNWTAAVSWAAGLTVGAFGDWRLPRSLQPDPACSNQADVPPYGTQSFGYGCTGSEIGYLWYSELGNIANTFTSAGPFLNLQHASQDGYWTGTAYAPDTGSAWYFISATGNQTTNFKSQEYYAVAVRSGDVYAGATVPEPGGLALLLAGIGAGVVGRARRRRTAARGAAGRSADFASNATGPSRWCMGVAAAAWPVLYIVRRHERGLVASGGTAKLRVAMACILAIGPMLANAGVIAANEPIPDNSILRLGSPGAFAAAQSFTSLASGILDTGALRFRDNGPIPAAIEVDFYASGAGGIPSTGLGRVGDSYSSGSSWTSINGGAFA